MPTAPRLAHHVFFSLTDNSPAKTEELVSACKQYLTDHPGLESFYVGTLNRELRRAVNDLDYDVSLHLVFVDRAAHDVYQNAPRHNQFIELQKANWKQVRVFDSDLA